MLEYNLGEFIDKIEEISGRATKEYALEKSLEKMKSDWEGIEFTLLPYRDTVCCNIQLIHVRRALNTINEAENFTNHFRA